MDAILGPLAFATIRQQTSITSGLLTSYGISSFFQTVADTVAAKTVTALQGTTTGTAVIGTGTTVEGTETGTGTVDTAAAAGGGMGMTDVSATDPPVLLGTTMTIRAVLPTMKMTDAPVTAAAKRTVDTAAEGGEEEDATTGGTEVSAAVAVDVTAAAAAGTRMALEPPREDPRLPKAHFPCRRDGGRPLAGMSPRPVMSSIRPCRPSKRVSSISPAPIGRKSRPSSVSLVFPRPCPCRASGWVLVETLIFLVNLAGFTLAASPPK
ncbi:hypothetical protein C8F04DRAFT_720709 [Mycena alexandri]|uniref:Uncharacterized protein n=1 Tax=Mycena alexandri TaxID=1745969 RepID=A0AAD6TCK9_9AGAR|nr:hypothetical protein C8F04DRAFT_720709 [Mycena alexandri]